MKITKDKNNPGKFKVDLEDDVIKIDYREEDFKFRMLFNPEFISRPVTGGTVNLAHNAPELVGTKHE